jgi:hypothetical protein
LLPIGTGDSRRHTGAFLLQNRALPDIRCERFQGSPEAAAWSAAIAQLVEHVIRNDGVTGSSPVCGTIHHIEFVDYFVRDIFSSASTLCKGTTA